MHLPAEVFVPVSASCDCAASQKRCFVALETGRCSWMVQVGPGESRGLYKRKAGGSGPAKGDVMMEAEVGEMHFEAGGRFPEPKNADGLWKLERQ